MEELALHVLDIAQNSIAAGATKIEIAIVVARVSNSLSITIKDNGKGMEQQIIEAVVDPFFTTRTTRRVGLGLPLLKAAAEQCDGGLCIESEPSIGTTVRVRFAYDHIDRVPLGSMAETLAAILAANAEVDILYRHEVDGKVFVLDTCEMREICQGMLHHPKIIEWLKHYIAEQEGLLGGE